MVAESWSQEQIEVRNARTKSPGFFLDPSKKIADSKIIAPPMRADRTISARIFPNGEFGVGFVPHRGISAQDRRYEDDCRYARENAEIVADIEVGAQYPEGFIYTRKIIPGSPPKLGIGSESSRVPKKYGLKGITAHGKKTIRNAGTVIDKAARSKYGHFVQMGTVTVPSYSPETMRNICTHWADIVRKFFQKLKRLYARHNRAFDYASVTEIQPQRLANRQEVGLHLHFLFTAVRCPRGDWILPDGVVRKKWQATLEIYLAQGDSGVTPNYRRESVNSSSAGYMAKYMSKGGKEIKQVIEEFGEEYLPSQWWSVSTSVRTCIAKCTVKSMGAEAQKLLCICSEGMEQYLKYVRCSTLTLVQNEYSRSKNCPEEIVLGYGGMLTCSGYELFKPTDINERISEYLLCTLDKS